MENSPTTVQTDRGESKPFDLNVFINEQTNKFISLANKLNVESSAPSESKELIHSYNNCLSLIENLIFSKSLPENKHKIDSIDSALTNLFSVKNKLSKEWSKNFDTSIDDYAKIFTTDALLDDPNDNQSSALDTSAMSVSFSKSNDRELSFLEKSSQWIRGLDFVKLRDQVWQAFDAKLEPPKVEDYSPAKNVPRKSLSISSENNIQNSLLLTKPTAISKGKKPEPIETSNLAMELAAQKALMANLSNPFSPSLFHSPTALLNSPTVHVPSKFNNAHRSVIISDDNHNILMVNDEMEVTFGVTSDLIIGKSIWSLLAPKYAEKYKSLLLARKEKAEESSSTDIIICGKLVRLLYQKYPENATFCASLWLNEKKNDDGNLILLWVFEKVQQLVLSITVTDKGTYSSSQDPLSRNTFLNVLGFDSNEMVHLTISDLVPALRFNDPPPHPTPLGPPDNSIIVSDVTLGSPSMKASFTVGSPIAPFKSSSLAFDKFAIGSKTSKKFVQMIKGSKYFGFRGKSFSEYSPSIIHASSTFDQSLINIEIILMPDISGVFMINKTGEIQSCNSLFSKYLFGYPSSELCKKWKIDSLLPTALQSLDSAMKSKQLAVYDFQQIPAIHRDGTTFSVDLRVKVFNDDSPSQLYACWITYSLEKSNRLTVISKSYDDRNDVLKALESPERANNQDVKISKLSEYDIIDKLGEGAFGYVKLVTRKNDPTKTKKVLKAIIKSKVLKQSWVKDGNNTITAEIKILKFMAANPHQSIVEMKHTFEDHENIYIEMDLHGFGMDLFDYIDLNKNMSEIEIKYIFRQVVSGIQHLHNHNIIHRDIKDENIILDQFCNIKIIDFGSGSFIEDGKLFYSFCGTMDYAAPEILDGNPYTGPPQDVWALGILLYILIYKGTPFPQPNDITRGKLKIPYILSQDSLDLILRILTRESAKRPTANEIAADKWFAC